MAGIINSCVVSLYLSVNPEKFNTKFFPCGFAIVERQAKIASWDLINKNEPKRHVFPILSSGAFSE